MYLEAIILCTKSLNVIQQFLSILHQLSCVNDFIIYLSTETNKSH